MTRQRLSALVIAAALIATALMLGLGRYPLLEPDEGRNAEVAREMAATRDFVVPHLDGLPYPDKPVLFFAATALSGTAFGWSETASRLPALLATLGTLGLIGWFARRRYGNAGTWTAVIAAATTPLTIAFARTVIFDSTLTLFVTAAVMAFAEGVDRAERRARAAWVWPVAAWAAIGLGVLTKGPIALALPLMIVLPWAVWRGQWRVTLDPVGILLATVIVAPWVLAMNARVPGFLHYALVTETARRLTTTELGRTGPLWYFLPVLLAGALPWSLLALATSRRVAAGVRRRDPDVILLLSWIIIPFVFFTLSQSKRPQYVLPLIPAVALLIPHVWRDCVGRLAGVRVAAGALLASGIIVAAACGPIAQAFGASAGVRAVAPETGWAIGALCVAGATLALTWPAHRQLVVLGLSLPTATLPVTGLRLIEQVAHERSAADLARAMRPQLGPSTRIVAAGTFPLSLPYYLGRTVLLASADARELTSNYLVRSPAARYADNTPLRPADWWRDAVLSCDRPLIVVVAADDRARRGLLEAHLPLVAETARYAAYGPCGRPGLALLPAPLERRP